jgi:CRP-like cAMP-binding protein
MPLNNYKVAERFIFKSDLIFAGLPEDVKEAFFKEMVIKQFKKDQNIFTEGTYPAGIFFIKRGKVKKYKMLNRGKEQIIYLCSEGELLGYAAFLGEERYPDSATALTDASIGFISREKLIRLLDQHEELMKMLMKSLSHEFGVLVNFIATFTQKTVRERVALALLILHEKFKDKANAIDDEVHIILTRKDFANFVGTAVETLVRLLRDFKDEHLITTEGRVITVIDKHQLLEIADVTDTF